jgi:carbon monoxide dehydrogenase subunit G
MKKKSFFLFFLLLLCTGVSIAQTRVSGKVIDENGDPIIGATIQIKGTGQGTVTDLDGNFTLSAPADGTLVISYVGMKTQEVSVAPNLQIVM